LDNYENIFKSVLKSSEWTIISSRVSKLQSGIHNLAVLLTDDSNVEIDWIRFEQAVSISQQNHRYNVKPHGTHCSSLLWRT